MQHLTACPVCQQTNFSAFLSCEDYTVSHETFHLQQCKDCGFVLTNPQPDESELPRYYQSDAYISHSNKTQNVIDRVYKVARNYTLNWKCNLVQKYSLQKPTSLLDFGCGTGAFLQQCQQHDIRVAGVEPSSIARTEAIKITSAPISPTMENVNGAFDVITLWHVLEHVGDLNGTIASLKQTLHDKGTMFIAVPNYKSSDARKYGKYWAAYDVPRHLWHFSQESMKMVLEKHKLNLAKVLPMPLDAYYVSLLSEKYQAGANSGRNMVRGLLEGWKSNSVAEQTNEYSSLIYIVRK